ncbi:FecR family protein [Steroidobacter sp.]|uniref:FecR family protein n=1 Tax=Steroidobacter sp. TaxID=1978227 RepID=UPI001A4121AC|nr:FecR domain-containing protein [Steroidobacter sp.]MBL8271248.1 FecR domain-containing protein [Steroidobacter sp.]
MFKDDQGMQHTLSPRAVEEAAAWLALLHGPKRDEDIVLGFQRWRGESVEHKAAFDAVTRMWEVTERLPKRTLALPKKWRRAGFRVGVNWGVAAVATAACAILGVLVAVHFYFSATTTAIGEQRMLTLEDGTRIYMNTATRIKVRFNDERREVELQAGEALFVVAKRGADWPFIVSAGDKTITALGTEFLARRDATTFAVTLVEGKVAVATEQSSGEAPTVLAPGERLTLAPTAPPRIDAPKIDELTAWRRGRVELNDVTLAQAIGEMNRYSTTQLSIETSAAAELIVKGSFRAGDTASFAETIASTCELMLIREPNRIRLSGVPSPNCRENNSAP